MTLCEYLRNIDSIYAVVKNEEGKILYRGISYDIPDKFLIYELLQSKYDELILGLKLTVKEN